jgi:hypothetical protein
MLCPKCNTQNSDSARYCNGCGTPMQQGCSRCGASLAPGARFCEGCGTPVGTPAAIPAVGLPDKRSDPVAAQPKPDYLQTPLPATEFGPSPRQDPPYAGSVPYGAPAAATALEPWRWAVAIVTGAVFLYNASIVIAITLFLLQNGDSLSRFSGQFVTDLALAGLAGCGVVWALQERKTALTFLAGGILLRSAIRILATLFTIQSPALLFEWLVIGAACAAALWWLWLKSPVETGDAARLGIALTALIGAELATVLYGFVTHPSYMRMPDLFGVAIVVGALALARVKLPAALGPAAGAVPGRESGSVTGIDPRFRRALMIVVYILVAVLLRILLRTAFR